MTERECTDDREGGGDISSWHEWEVAVRLWIKWKKNIPASALRIKIYPPKDPHRLGRPPTQTSFQKFALPLPQVR
jgi:hypothetical protein